jgi:hypothetical protein
MALFNWFSGKSDAQNSLRKPALARDDGKAARNSRPTAVPVSMPPSSSSQPAHDTSNRSEQRKAKRHARREQLYVAVRESMTRAGVLSASYKFKVLSLDHRGDQFLVMMDVHPSLGGQVDKLSETETLIAQTAKTLFGMTVTSVYWRLDVKPGTVAVRTKSAESRPAELPAALDAHDVKKPPAQRYEPIHQDEVTAFKQALAMAAEQNPGTPDAAGKTRSGLRSYTLITGFEDTEMPESSSAPALSATQYGDLT